ncbi:MAG: hypothetical protein H0V30_09150 [Chitinophagaceae bacterium]|jgi:chromosome segregation ATPase|nr:hypothetical protein [Chitinophagaceae bacterium]
MVHSDISQISHECNTWRDSLRQHRQEITNLKSELQEIAANLHSKSALLQVEHYHNQFHIQLINIHDLKQDIKLHDRKVLLESSSGQLNDQTLADHESLFDQFQVLEHTLQDLRSDFKNFKENSPITA